VPLSVEILLAEEFGWVRRDDAAGTVWFKGYAVMDGASREGADAAQQIARALDACVAPSALAEFLARLDGSYAAIRQTGARTVATVDRMRSIPLLFARLRDGVAFDDRGRRLASRLGSPRPDADGALELAMAGYAGGDSTLYDEIRQLRAGELAVVENGRLERRRFYAYRSWELSPPEAEPALRRRLVETTLAILDKTIRGLAGRPIMLPLSAGYDSRLIASGLKHLGFRDVHCYAYGRPGNHEAAASRAIADRLGYPWRFVPYSPSRVRALAATAQHAAYMDFADTLAGVPFLQDFLAIDGLKRARAVPEGAVFVNGNSGDFISGNHIHPDLLAPRPDLSWRERRERVVQAYIGKHFSLWRDLRTPANDARIGARAAAALDEALPGEVPAAADHGLYEFLECQERQAKFVVSGQRVYEFFGHAWRLPLWDNDYLDFWKPLPLAAKAHQLLYRETLEAENWGGVWRDIPLNAKTVSPAWIRPLRRAAQLACLPFGKRAWRGVDRRVFAYWTDLLSTYAAVPYGRVLFDRRGFRNAVAVRCADYLARKGLGRDGQPARA
jgi:asparagine synthase (glutamine-hydrolysing)